MKRKSTRITKRSKKNSITPSPLDVPKEILGLIFSYLDIVSLCRADQVSKEFNHVISQIGDINLWDISFIRKECGMSDSEDGNVNNEIFGNRIPQYFCWNTGVRQPIISLPLLKWKNGIYHSQSMEARFEGISFTKRDAVRLYRNIQDLGKASRIALDYKLDAGGDVERFPVHPFIIPSFEGTSEGFRPITHVIDAFGVRRDAEREDWEFLLGEKGDNDNEDPVFTEKQDDFREWAINQYNGLNKISRIFGCKNSGELELPAMAIGA